MKTILVVDDFSSIQMFLCKTLEKKGYKTIGASDGNEAYEILSENKVDLVLSDYNMPNCTGMELLNKIKSNNETEQIPVIFLTTETNPEKMQAAKLAGLFAWVRKPYNADAFFAQIENALAQQQLN
ncbi:response regulator [Fulvivirga sp. 29W222]|uniref:Response regulator n=1 Tax=Fulvivirga marina TaxID=2494733 RepID=A0A937KGD2_9BACT|nr:response regulator [Fulvivirga marina]MBL6449285.1 response regulator [Fulvivirga marina]